MQSNRMLMAPSVLQTDWYEEIKGDCQQRESQSGKQWKYVNENKTFFFLAWAKKKQELENIGLKFQENHYAYHMQNYEKLHFLYLKQACTSIAL